MIFRKNKEHSEARVGVIMGSISDKKIMDEASELLTQFEVPHEMRIVSAHRTPQWMGEYASSARECGLEVIIAGAGGAAHLPGMVASLTSLPVIGVPIALKKLSGWDSLLSIVSMPRGVPVATVAIDGAGNAALLALRILAVHDKHLAQALEQYAEEQGEKSMDHDAKLENDLSHNE